MYGGRHAPLSLAGACMWPLHHGIASWHCIMAWRHGMVALPLSDSLAGHPLASHPFFFFFSACTPLTRGSHLAHTSCVVLCAAVPCLRRRPGQMQKAFEDAVLALAVGALSGPVVSDSGVHIILRTG